MLRTELGTGDSEKVKDRNWLNDRIDQGYESWHRLTNTETRLDVRTSHGKPGKEKEALPFIAWLEVQGTSLYEWKNEWEKGKG